MPIAAKRRNRPAVTAAVAGLLVMGLAACGSDDDAGGNAATASGGSGTYADVRSAAQERVRQFQQPIESVDLQLDALPDGKNSVAGKKILVVPAASAIFADMQASVTEGIKAAGASADVCDGKVNPSEIANCLNSAVTSEVDGVITLGIDPDAASEAYKALGRAGIPTYGAWGSASGFPESDKLRFGENSAALKASLEAATDYAMATSEEPLNALLIGIGDTKALEQINEDWFAYAQKTCTGCKQSTELLTAAQAPKVASLVSSTLVKNPDLNTVMTFNVDSFGPPAVEGIANSPSKPKLGGNGSGGAALGLIKEGRVDFDAATSNYYQGWAAVDGLLRLMTGAPAEEYPTVLRVFDKEAVAGLDLAPENGASFEWFGDAPFIDAFKKAWGV